MTTPGGDRVTCRSYQVATPNPDGFLPSPAYKQTIVRGALACGLPAEYRAHLDAIVDNGIEGGGPA